MREAAIILIIGFFLDLVIGDPTYPFHPVRIIGNMISFFTRGLSALCIHTTLGGILLVLLVQGTTLFAYLLLDFFFHHLSPTLVLIFNVFMCYSLLALKDLVAHVRPVYSAITSQNTPRARELLSKVVGRDVYSLDRTGIIRAAIETLAENLVDGFISPVFWYVTGAFISCLLGLSVMEGGVCFMFFYKGANTLDSMVGYKTTHLQKFGWASARLDDFMNFFPARIAIPLLFVGGLLARSYPFSGLKVALRDRLKHDSPNAAHAEAFVAGALKIRLGGPTVYAAGTKQKPWLGAEFLNPETPHILKAICFVKWSAYGTMALAITVLSLSARLCVLFAYFSR